MIARAVTAVGYETVTYPALADLWKHIARARRARGDHKGAAAAFRTARMMKRRSMARGLEEANRWSRSESRRAV